MSDLYSVFHNALEKLAAGEADAAHKLMGDPYKKAYAEADTATQEVAKKLHEQVHNALKPEAKNHIAPFAQQALAALGTDNGLEAAAHHLHDAMHKIDHTRAEQASALTAQEAKLYEEKGVFGYTRSLVSRRWSKGQKDAAATQEAPKPHAHGHGHCDGHHHTQAATKIAAKEEVSLGAAALEEYAGIRHLNTTGRKLAISGGAAVGVGLIIHGGMNTARAFRNDREENLDIHQQKESGTNWTRLLVGIGEMAAGAAVAYRMLTGRWGLRGPVKGMADPLMECGHEYGH